jgi:PAS domain S-box-containing protein
MNLPDFSQFRMSEPYWRGLILIISAAVILFTIWCLSLGITIIFMHLYYFPIVLLTYRYRNRGFVLATFISLAYVGLVVIYHPEQAEITDALYRFAVFVGIAGVTAFLSERLDNVQMSQKERLDTIRNLQQFQESVITNANVWISVLAPNGTLLIWNDAAEAISGYKKSDVVGKRTVWKQLYPDNAYRKKVTGEIQRIIEQDTFLENFETEIRCADGTTKTIIWNTRGIRDSVGTIQSYIAIGRDITKQKQAEESLLESQAMYKSVLENFQDIYYRSDLEGRLILASPSWAQLLGYDSLDECIGYGIAEKFYARPEDRKEFIDAVQEKDYVRNYEVDLKKKDGTIITVSTNSHFYYDRSGNVLGIEGTFRDITDLKRAEKALHESERRFADIISFLPDATVVIDKNGMVLAWNRAMEEMTGIHAEQMIGKANYEYALPFYHERRPMAIDCILHDDLAVAAKYSVMKKAGKFLISEILIPHLNKGKGAYLWFTASALYDTDGNITGAIESIRDITERKRAEETLKESEFRFRTMVDWTYDWEYWVDSHRQCIYISPSAERITGYRHNEFMADPDLFDRIVHPDDRMMWDAHVPLHLGTTDAGPAEIEFRIMHKDGSVRWIHHLCRSICFDDGTCIGRRVSNQDITERKKADEALQESREFLNKIINSIGDPIHVKDRQHRIILINDAVCRLFNLSREEIIGKTAYDLFGAKEMADNSWQKDEEVFRTGEEVVNEETNTYTTGKTLTVLVKKTLYTDIAGNQFLVGLSTDITDRKQAELALRHSEEKFRDIFNNANDGIEIVELLDNGMPGRFTDVNDVACRMLGYTREEMLRISPLDIDTDYYSRPFDEIMQELHTAGHATFETEHRRIDGIIVPVEVNTHKISLMGKTVSLSIVRDITERKKAEDLLKHFNEELENKVKARTEELNASLDEKVILLREIHHRVKNNLQIIISLTNLQMRQAEDPVVKEIMAETQSRVRAMALVHEKLYGSKSLSRIDFADYTRFLATQHLSYYGSGTKKVRLDFVMSEIMVDVNTAVPLGLVMNELISNAFKHAFPNGREGTISLRGRDDGNLITIVVKDNGIGIPADFDWKNTTSLGMRLIISLVDQLNGTIDMDAGGGTTFRIQIPMNSAF